MPTILTNQIIEFVPPVSWPGKARRWLCYGKHRFPKVSHLNHAHITNIFTDYWRQYGIDLPEVSEPTTPWLLPESVELPMNSHHRFAAVCLSGYGTQKHLPSNIWIPVVRLLREKGYYPVLIAKRKIEVNTAKFISKITEAPVYNMLSLPELAYFLYHCKLAIGHDSGPIHLAAAVGTRNLSLFHCSTATAFRPRGPWSKTYQSKNSTECPIYRSSQQGNCHQVNCAHRIASVYF